MDVSSGFMEIFRKLYRKRQSGYSHMLNDATCFKKIFIVTGYTDLRSGIDRLAYTVRSYLGEDAIEPDTLYLFCGRRTDRIKGLVWENDGYLLLYIEETGVVVENPVIGHIPSRQEIVNELEELLMTM